MIISLFERSESLQEALSFLKSHRRRLARKPLGDGGFIERQGHLQAQEKPDDYQSFPFKSSSMNSEGFEKIMDCWGAVGVEVVVVDPAFIEHSNVHWSHTLDAKKAKHQV